MCHAPEAEEREPESRDWLFACEGIAGAFDEAGSVRERASLREERRSERSTALPNPRPTLGDPGGVRRVDMVEDELEVVEAVKSSGVEQAVEEGLLATEGVRWALCRTTGGGRGARGARPKATVIVQAGMLSNKRSGGSERG